MPEFYIDGSNFEEAVHNLFEAADRVDAETVKAMNEIGLTFAETARKVAGEHSSKIPPSIKPPEPVKHGIAVRAGDGVPLAALYDLGNEGKGNRRRPTFKHPVYARGPRSSWTWVEQKRFPFFAPTRKLLRKWIDERMVRIWDESLRPFTRE